MIKTKMTFIIFSLLTVIVFPYYIICIDSGFLSSIIPGWNTTTIPLRIISSLIKFIILSIVSFYYFKLSGNTKKIDLKKFIIHLSLTLPAILAAKLNVYQFVEINLHYPESFLSQIQMVIAINTIINILFFTGQILFGINYFRIQKKQQFFSYRKAIK